MVFRGEVSCVGCKLERGNHILGQRVGEEEWDGEEIEPFWQESLRAFAHVLHSRMCPI